MRKQQFKTLGVGDVVHYEQGGAKILDSIASAERWGVSPGVYETSSITLEDGARCKVDDREVKYLKLIKRATPNNLHFWPCIFNSREARTNIVVGPLMLYDEARAFLEENYLPRWRALEAVPQPETMEKELIFPDEKEYA